MQKFPSNITRKIKSKILYSIHNSKSNNQHITASAVNTPVNKYSNDLHDREMLKSQHPNKRSSVQYCENSKSTKDTLGSNPSIVSSLPKHREWDLVRQQETLSMGTNVLGLVLRRKLVEKELVVSGNTIKGLTHMRTAREGVGQAVEKRTLNCILGLDEYGRNPRTVGCGAGNQDRSWKTLAYLISSLSKAFGKLPEISDERASSKARWWSGDLGSNALPIGKGSRSNKTVKVVEGRRQEMASRRQSVQGAASFYGEALNLNERPTDFVLKLLHYTLIKPTFLVEFPNSISL